MQRNLLLFLVLVLQLTIARAHIGNPDIALEGKAGPYHILVNIRPPDVIPGTASITVFIENAGNDPGSIKVYARPIYFYSGKNGAPSPDGIAAVPGQPGQFKGIVWLMDDGSSSVELTITGPAGSGELVVPVVAVSTAEKKLPAGTTYTLIGLGAFLFILMITIIGSSVSDGITKKGEPIPLRRRRSKLVAFGLAAILSSLLVYGGNSWWQSEARAYRKYMFRPMRASYQVIPKEGSNELRLTINPHQEERANGLPYIIPDHGKLMHLFLLRLPAMDVFAHLHPVRTDSVSFTAGLPSLPKGRYLAYADIVYNSGFTETMKDTFAISSDLSDKGPVADPDDAWATALPDDLVDDPLRTDKRTIVCGPTGTGAKMKDGSLMQLEGLKNNEPYESGRLYMLHFPVYDKNGQPAVIEPYMGLKGHAIVVRNDGNVFVHIHPVGTYSMAAQSNLVNRMGSSDNEYRLPDKTRFRDSIDGVVKSLQGMSEKERNDRLVKEMNMQEDTTGPGVKGMNTMKTMGGNTVSFPYTFPSPGQYRIWVQVRKDGQILTAAFDRMVK